MRIYYILYSIARRWGPQQPRARQANDYEAPEQWAPPPRMVAYKRHLVNTAASAALRAARDIGCAEYSNAKRPRRRRRRSTHAITHVCQRAPPTARCTRTSTSLYIGARRVGRSSLSPLGLIEIYEIVLAPAGQSRATAIRRRLHGIHGMRTVDTCMHACERRCTARMHSVHVYCARRVIFNVNTIRVCGRRSALQEAPFAVIQPPTGIICVAWHTRSSLSLVKSAIVAAHSCQPDRRRLIIEFVVQSVRILSPPHICHRR